MRVHKQKAIVSRFEKLTAGRLKKKGDWFKPVSFYIDF
jgi:hypothetical protein